MKRIIIVIVGLMACFGAVVGYGQEKADTQSTAQSQENKTFDKPLGKRVEEAVSGMDSYDKELQKEIGPMKDGKEQEKMFFSKLRQYISRYVRNNSIGELLALEAKVIKKGEGPETTYGWFYVTIHNTVLKLAGYSPITDVPITDKILEIIQDKSVDDYIRSKYVIDVRLKITDLHNRRMEVDEKIRERIYPVLIKIIDDINSSSELRAEAAATLVSIGRKNAEVTNYVVKLLDDKDDLVKDRTMWYCDLKNDKFRNKIVSMLANRGNYSKKVIDRIQRTLTRWPSETSEVVPYLLEMLKEAKNVEEFRKIASDLQEYNDPKVLEPILQKVKELELQIDSIRDYFENSLLLDYLAMAKEEDKLLILKLIYETDYQMIGNVYIPPYFGKAVTALKEYILSPDAAIQKEAIEIYGEIIEMAGSLSDESIRKDAVSKLGDIKKIILDGKDKSKNPTIVADLDKLLTRIEKMENQSKEP